MSDTFITVIAILLAVVLLVVVPLQVTSQRVDTMSKLDVDTLTSDFVEQIRTTGSIQFLYQLLQEFQCHLISM